MTYYRPRRDNNSIRKKKVNRRGGWMMMLTISENRSMKRSRVGYARKRGSDFFFCLVFLAQRKREGDVTATHTRAGGVVAIYPG